MLYILPKPPLRPMEPAYVSKILTRNKVDRKLKTGFVKILRTYNKSINKAVNKYESACKSATDKMERDFNKL
jgi:hypothetical protein